VPSKLTILAPRPPIPGGQVVGGLTLLAAQSAQLCRPAGLSCV